MYTLVHVLPYCYIRFRASGKGSKADVQNFYLLAGDVNITSFIVKCLKIKD